MSNPAWDTFEEHSAEIMECIICGRTYKSHTALAHHQKRHDASAAVASMVPMRHCDQCELQVPNFHWRDHTLTDYHEAKKRREICMKHAQFDVLN